MMRLISDLGKDGEHGWGFHCPGCKCGHRFFKDGRWQFNGDYEKPTFSPSLLNTHLPNDARTKGLRCHLFVRDGMIQFLGDCTHELAGKTVPVVPL